MYVEQCIQIIINVRRRKEREIDKLLLLIPPRVLPTYPPNNPSPILVRITGAHRLVLSILSTILLPISPTPLTAFGIMQYVSQAGFWPMTIKLHVLLLPRHWSMHEQNSIEANRIQTCVSYKSFKSDIYENA